MTTDRHSNALLLSDYVRVIVRRRAMLAVGVLLGGILAWLFTNLTGPEYESKASVLVKPVGMAALNPSARPDQLVNLPTERQLIRSTATVNLAAEKMGSPDASPSSMLSHLTITIPEGTQILEISFSAKDPETAQAGAQAFADAYLEQRRAQAEVEVQERAEHLASEIENVSRELDEANARFVASEEGSLERTLAQADIELLTSRLRDFHADLADLELVSVDPGSVIAPATLPTKPSSQPPWLLTVVGAFAGGILALPLAFTRDRLDRRIWDESDIETLPVGPVLGSVPARPGPLSGSEDRRTVTDAYRKACQNIVSALALSGGRKIAVTSTNADASETTAGLASAMASLKYSVLLMGTYYTEHLREALPVRPAAHLQTILDEELPLSSGVQTVRGLSDLRVVSGTLPPNARANWKTFTEMVEPLPDETDFFVFHAPPITESVDALQASALMDAVVLVAFRGRTTRDALDRAASQLEAAGTKVLGVVIAKAGRMRRPRPNVSSPQAEQDRSGVSL